MDDTPIPADQTSWHKLSQVKNLPPTWALVFIDEHESSHGNARFLVPSRVSGPGSITRFRVIKTARAGG